MVYFPGRRRPHTCPSVFSGTLLEISQLASAQSSPSQSIVNMELKADGGAPLLLLPCAGRT